MSCDQVQQLSVAITAVKARKPRKVYFVACGGSLAYMYQQQYILDVEMPVATTVISSNEFIHRNPKDLGPDCLVISCSHSGNTPETVEATAFARRKGALTIAYSFKEESPLGSAAEYNLRYEWGDEADAYRGRTGMALRLIFGILEALQPAPKYALALETLKGLNGVLARNKAKFAAAADTFGSDYKRAPLIYTMGSGAAYGEAYSFAICLLQEMLWIHSAAIHSGEYFHGPFEITDYDVPFLVLKTAGETRPLDERAHAFMRKYSQKITVVDAQDFDWSGVDPSLHSYFSAAIFGAVLRSYAEGLAEHRGHPLSVRRYMWKMEY